MASSTEIANLALSHLGSGKEISNLETERSDEASAMRRYYSIALSTALKDYPYSFCNVIETLALVEESPNDEWAYSYRYPTDCLKPIRILSGFRNDSRQTRIPYKIGKDASGKLIYTDQSEAELEYTQRVTDPSKFPDDFIMALSFLIAALAAPRICGEDPYKLGDRALKLYQHYKGKADSHDVNDQQQEEPPEAQWITDRGTSEEDEDE